MRKLSQYALLLGLWIMPAVSHGQAGSDAMDGMEIAALAMSGSSALVAVNALMLKRTRLAWGHTPSVQVALR